MSLINKVLTLLTELCDVFMTYYVHIFPWINSSKRQTTNILLV